VSNASIVKEFRFKSYLAGIEFGYDVGELREDEDHHPDIHITWRRVIITWSTHSIKDLTKNDLIMATKTEVESTN